LREPSRIVKAAARAAAPVWGHDEFTPFVVLSRSRTGSNLLASFFNSHPQAHVEGEILGRLEGRDVGRVLGRVWGPQAHYVRAKGFKLFYYHPLDGCPQVLWTRIVEVPGLHVIHLKRRNILRTLVSRKIASARGEWIRAGRTVSRGGIPVRFDREELEEGFRQTREWEEQGDERMATLPSVVLVYEDLIADPVGEFNRATRLLGLRDSAPSSEFQRQNPEPLADLIENFDELRRGFRGTAWEEFFDEGSVSS
jgi:hypothetical protein